MCSDANVAVLRIALLQIAGHPALAVDGHDFLTEPLGDELPHLAEHEFNFPKLRPVLRATRSKYVDWAKARAAALLDAIASSPSGAPALLALPECLVPQEGLPDVAAFSRRTGTVVLAGTHSRMLSPAGDKLYEAAGVSGQVHASLPSAAAFMPVVTASTTSLRPKVARSPFEESEGASSTKEPDLTNLPVFPLQGELTVGPLICAEALRRPQFHPKPSLVGIVARDPNPAQFDNEIQSFVRNKQPVIFVNDARHGGSGVFCLVDTRPSGRWFFGAPMNGRLPTGEAYLEIDLDPEVKAIEVGTAAPSQGVHIRRLCSIYSKDDPILALEQAALAAARNGNVAALRVACNELDRHQEATVVARQRWSRLLQLAENASLDDDWIAILGMPLVIDVPRLETLRADLCGRAAREIQQIIDDPASRSADPRQLGLLVQTRHTFASCATSSNDRTGARTPPPSAPPPVGRGPDISALLTALSESTSCIAVITGLPSIGKSAVINTALGQAHMSTVHIDCPPGASADFLYEAIIRHAGFVPASPAPRQTFDSDEMVEALRGTRALWISSVHELALKGHSSSA